MQIPPIQGQDIRYCYITDPIKHEQNQKILAGIIEEELRLNWPQNPLEQATHLQAKIMQISTTLLNKGFLKDAYDVPECAPNSILAFYAFPLWEGKSIPLTFFVYIWPQKKVAMLYNPAYSRYASIIHSHPIPCAFAVLHGTLTQNNYNLVSSKTVRFSCEDRFEVGEGDIDNLQQSFIHKLYNKHANLCISLHAYSLPTAEQVNDCFQETRSECTYKEFGP